jgi:Holliday junction resolvase RusA-like endonuclease
MGEGDVTAGLEDPKAGYPTVFYQNPFYHSLFGFFGVDVPSKRLRFHIDHAAEVVTLTQPQSGRQFEAYVRESLTPEPGWPLSGRLLLAMSVTLPLASFEAKDVDNIAKSVLDALKGVVYEDDRQVVSLFVSKSQGELGSFFVGIRSLGVDETSWYFPSLYSDTPYPGQVRRQ